MSDGAPPPGQPMEDILASIKRIITDEASTARRPAAAWPGATPDDVLELGEPVAAPAAQPMPAPAAQPMPAPVAPAPVAPIPAVPSPVPQPAAEALVSSGVRDASRQALASLAALKVDAAAPAGTLDGLVREMLRPMLKEWLDANLPDLVERVVAREVARLTGR